MPRTLGAILILVLAVVILLVAFARVLALGVTFRDGWRASSWILVQATVTAADLSESRSRRYKSYLAEGEYRYTFAGAEYVSHKLGLAAHDSGDWLAEWHMEMAGFLSQAQGADRTIAVYVNPDKPGQSVVDRDIRWGLSVYRLFEAIALALVGMMVWKMALQPPHRKD